MPHIGPPELILIVILALIIFGPGKLPDVGKALGKTIKEFRRSAREIGEEKIEATEELQENQAPAKAVK